MDTLRQAYEQLSNDSEKISLPFEDVVGNDAMADVLSKVQAYTSRLLATKAESAPGHLFINGKHVLMGGVRLGRRIVMLTLSSNGR